MTTKPPINNAPLLPEYVPDDRVTVDENGTPDWAADLILAEVRIATATEEGTLKSAVRVLDHYAGMGVNALWICPVYQPGADGNGYGNLGPHTVDPSITGTEDYEQGWLEVGRFVGEAHKRNLRILLDIITWGTYKDVPLHSEHPDWYTGKQEWGGDAFDWKNEEFKEWFISRAVDVVVKTGCDGLRLDVEPYHAGYEVCGEIRRRLLALGRKPLMMSEHGNERRGAYDCEQIGLKASIDGFYTIDPEYYFLKRFNMVDCIKNGEQIGAESWETENNGCMNRFYVNTVTCHDNRYPVICGNRLAIGYQAIFSPFLPQWWIGEEWNNPQTVEDVLYFNTIDWAALELPENRAFYEDVKRMIRIRRSYPEIFTYYPAHFRDTNICKVTTSNKSGPCAYARYAGGRALLIVPNMAQETAVLTVTVPFAEAGLDGKAYTVTDAETGGRIADGICRENNSFTADVPSQDQRLFLLEPFI